MRDEQYQECPDCQGEGRYYLAGTASDRLPFPPRQMATRDVEKIDPCDYCHGDGEIPVPVIDNDKYEQPGLFA